MYNREPTIRSRELGDGLRRVMTDAGLHASELARQLDRSPSRVSRLLSGKRGGSGYDVSAFLAICGVRGIERDRLMALAHDQHRRSRHQQHGAVLPKQVRTLIDHESRAVRISEFQFNLIPGLLQTGDYIRALLGEAGRIPAEEIDDRVEAKLGRHNVFIQPQAPGFTFYLHEFALCLPVGGSVVMSDQLHHLLRMSVRSNVTIRVLPAAFGAHVAPDGSFVMLEFREFRPIVYLDSETSSLFLELPVEIGAYREILTALDRTALPEGLSREFIGDLAVSRYS